MTTVLTMPDAPALDPSGSALPEPRMSLVHAGRPRKADTVKHITIFLDNPRRKRMFTLAKSLMTKAGQDNHNNQFRSAALRELLDRGLPAVESTSNRSDASGSSTSDYNQYCNFYMSREYLERLDQFIADVKQSGKVYNRSMAVRDLIDLHLVKHRD